MDPGHTFSDPYWNDRHLYLLYVNLTHVDILKIWHGSILATPASNLEHYKHTCICFNDISFLWIHYKVYNGENIKYNT